MKNKVPQRIGLHNGSIQTSVRIASLNHLKSTNIVHNVSDEKYKLDDQMATHIEE